MGLEISQSPEESGDHSSAGVEDAEEHEVPELSSSDCSEVNASSGDL